MGRKMKFLMKCENQIHVTDRERIIIQLLSRDMSRQEIARELHVSEKTIANHITAILSKLDARSRMGAVMKAIKLGIINVE